MKFRFVLQFSDLIFLSFLPQRGYEKINTFLSNAKRLAKVEVLLVVEFIRFKLCRAKGILGLFS